MKIITIIAPCLVIFGCTGSQVSENKEINLFPLPPLEKEATLPLPENIKSFVLDAIPINSHWPDFKITREILEEVLGEWHQVSKEQWLHGYSHVAMEDRTGRLILKEGVSINWMVKPGGLATLGTENGTTVYLAKELIR
jgi:hypothetical protein